MELIQLSTTLSVILELIQFSTHCGSFQNLYNSRPLTGRFETYKTLDPLRVILKLIQLLTICGSFQNLYNYRPLAGRFETYTTIELLRVVL